HRPAAGAHGDLGDRRRRRIDHGSRGPGVSCSPCAGRAASAGHRRVVHQQSFIRSLVIMSASRAIILAAGNGTRMGRLTADRPKAMLDVDGQSIVERALDALAWCGIDDVTLVVGYQQERLRQHLGARVRFIENPRYRETNSLYSLWLAREIL